MTVGVGDGEYAVWQGKLQPPITFVNIAVVVWAKRHEVVHVGRAIVSPVGNVVRLTLRNWHLAIGNCAVRIHRFDCFALIASCQP